MSEQIWETVDNLFKTVHRQNRRVEELETRLAELERRLADRPAVSIAPRNAAGEMPIERAA